MRVLRQSEVTSAMTAWAQSIHDDPAKLRLDYSETRPFGDRATTARVEWHSYVGRTGQIGVHILGVTLYSADDAPVVAPHDADYSPALAHVEGVDVSHFQASVNWTAVRAAGRTFAFIKATEGLTYTDASLSAHWTGSGAAGLLRGAYHFFRASSDPISQVLRFIEVARAVGSWELPLALDVEWQSATSALGGLSAGEFGDAAVEALQELERNVRGSGTRKPLLYVAPGFWSLLRPEHRTELARSADLWLAQYTSGSPVTPSEFGAWAFWQYSDKGSISGYPASADSNRFAGSLEQLRAYASGTPPPAPALDLSTTLGVQRALVLLGAHLTLDGLPGPATTAVVKTFQAEHGLVADGVVGPNTRSFLRTVLALLRAAGVPS